MLLTFAGLSLVCTQLPAQQSAAVALNEPVRAQIEALKDSDVAVRTAAAEGLIHIGPDAKAAQAASEASGAS